MAKLIVGMDEAGRGPPIGPLVIGIVGITPAQEKLLQELGIKDSKKLKMQQHKDFTELIKQHSTFCDTLIVPAHEIDALRDQITLNEIEVFKFRELLQRYRKYAGILQLDAADVNAERFGSHFVDMIKGEIISEHKADGNYIAVGAASICAKYVRDTIIAKYREQYKEEGLPLFTKGYPKDAQPFLKAYVAKYGHLPDIARVSWKTCTKILTAHASKQLYLDKFL